MAEGGRVLSILGGGEGGDEDVSGGHQGVTVWGAPGGGPAGGDGMNDSGDRAGFVTTVPATGLMGFMQSICEFQYVVYFPL